MGSDSGDSGCGSTHGDARGGVIDWTLTPAKWGAVGVLALAGCMGLAWSVIRGEARIAAQGENRARPSQVEPKPLASLPPASAATSDPRGEPEDPRSGAGQSSLDNSGNQPQLDASASSPPSDASPQSTSSPAPAQGAAPAPTTVTPPDPPPPAPDPTIAQRVNINTATEAELQVLPGIGPSRARAIIEDRRVNGQFRSVEELDRVRGIGPGIIEGLRDFARVR